MSKATEPKKSSSYRQVEIAELPSLSSCPWLLSFSPCNHIFGHSLKGVLAKKEFFYFFIYLFFAPYFLPPSLFYIFRFLFLWSYNMEGRGIMSSGCPDSCYC